MIIDVILDRYDGSDYKAEDITAYADIFGYSDLAKAMEHGTEDDTKRELIKYLCANEYNTKIATFVNACDWQKDDNSGNVWSNVINIDADYSF